MEKIDELNEILSKYDLAIEDRRRKDREKYAKNREAVLERRKRYDATLSEDRKEARRQYKHDWYIAHKEKLKAAKQEERLEDARQSMSIAPDAVMLYQYEDKNGFIAKCWENGVPSWVYGKKIDWGNAGYGFTYFFKEDTEAMLEYLQQENVNGCLNGQIKYITEHTNRKELDNPEEEK